jgi:uncharacterized protein (DUF1015 family)
MANINAFRGLRPKKELVEQVAVLPYDVVSTEEAREMAGDNRLNFFHISKPEIDFPSGVDYQDPRVYAHGKKYLDDMVDQGILFQDQFPCLYLYTQILNGREQTGLVACVSIDDYLDKTIKKHELTREDKENDRANHIEMINAHTGQVFLFFNDDGAKKRLFQQALQETPAYDFISEDGVRQILRIINDKDLIASFKAAFKDDILYIADGHHRAAAAARVGQRKRMANPGYTGEEEFNKFMAVIFPHHELKILAYNRAVRDLNGLTKDQFTESISKDFYIQPVKNGVPDSVREIRMYQDHAWRALCPRFDPGADPILSLDVKIIQDYILGPILGILDPRKDTRIEFVGGPQSVSHLTGLVDSGSAQVAFSLFPTSIDQLMRVSDADEIMPPKSTWFVPKLRSGIVVHLL